MQQAGSEYKVVRNIFCLALLVTAVVTMAHPVQALDVGFASVDITPEVSDGSRVWIAGYGQNRRAEGVHDPLYVRTVVLRDGDAKIALAAADVVGLHYDTVKLIREQLPEFQYVLASATHNHEGPDTMGIWGPSPFQTGIDRRYMERLIEAFTQAVKEADAAAVPVSVEYGTAQDDTLLRDSRLPHVYDGILRVLKFTRTDGEGLAGILVQWNCHPECMGGGNKQITADFPYAMIDTIRAEHDAPVTLFTGAVGGLMAPPRGLLKNDAGDELREGDFAYTEAYGRAVGDLVLKALASTSPIKLTPFAISARPIAVPIHNKLFQVASMAKLMPRQGRVWAGDLDKLGEPFRAETKNEPPAAESEVAYLRLGELAVVGIPGEIYPELVYGQYQDPVDPGADYPEASLEPSVVDLIPEDRFLLIGLANDELGYIIPQRQWDSEPPFAYGRDSDQYGEENSIGYDAAPILMEALRRRVSEISTAE